MCTKSSTIWKKFDLNNRLMFKSFRDLEHYPKAMEESLHVNHKGEWFSGYDALIQITKQLPLLWMVLPFMHVFKRLGLGDAIYKKIAQKRKLVPVHQCQDGVCQIQPKKN
jgi:predicted DCC family thiol-disulfide oxidoreductase YuxK